MSVIHFIPIFTLLPYSLYCYIHPIVLVWNHYFPDMAALWFTGPDVILVNIIRFFFFFSLFNLVTSLYKLFISLISSAVSGMSVARMSYYFSLVLSFYGCLANKSLLSIINLQHLLVFCRRTAFKNALSVVNCDNCVEVYWRTVYYLQ